MRVVVTEIGWDGSIRRSALETAGLPDAGRWEYLIEQVLAIPPRYQAAPGSPVYVIHAGDRAVLVSEENLAGSLHALVSTILEAGSPALAAKQPANVTLLLVPPLTPRAVPPFGAVATRSAITRYGARNQTICVATGRDVAPGRSATGVTAQGIQHAYSAHPELRRWLSNRSFTSGLLGPVREHARVGQCEVAHWSLVALPGFRAGCLR